MTLCSSDSSHQAEAPAKSEAKKKAKKLSRNLRQLCWVRRFLAHLSCQ